MGARDIAMRQIPLDIGLSVEPSFETFVPGANAAALSHLQGLQAPAAPVYLWGPDGSGKTHLLRAMVGRCQARGLQCAWFRPGDPVPWNLRSGWGLVIIDDADRLDVLEQHAAFALLIDAAECQALIVAAGALPPVDLALREDLRTRLGWGHVFALEPLSEAETRSALRQEADRRGIFLPDDVMDHLLNRFARDLKHLMTQLDRLDQFAMAQRRAVTLPLLRAMLADSDTDTQSESGSSR
jgi:DnaA family protein